MLFQFLILVATAIFVWDDAIMFFKGKRVAILGARGVGKTHLMTFLASGSIPAAYKQTIAPEKIPERRFQLKDLNIKLKSTLDLSGDKAAYAEWKQLQDEADVILYLLRADLLIKGDVNAVCRVRDDLQHIAGWLATKSTRPLFFIIGTHCDRIGGFDGLADDNVGDFVDTFRRLPIVSESVARGGGPQQVKVILGSMKSVQGTEKIVCQIFEQATK